MTDKDLFYEDVEIGQHFVGTGRTVTDADLTFMCMMSGDWHPLHCDVEYARTSPFGGRIVGGVYGLIVTTGALSRWGSFDNSTLGMLSIDEWTFKAPIYVGDTLTVEMTIVAKRLTKKADRGIIDRRFDILNQDKALVQTGRSAMMIALRSHQKDGAATMGRDDDLAAGS